MKTFKEFYKEQIYFEYPGSLGEEWSEVWLRVADGIAAYIDYAIEEKFNEQE